MTVIGAPPERTLLPFRHLRWRSTVVALSAVAGPVCVVTSWLAVQSGRVLPALVLTLLIAAAALVLTWRVMASRIELERDGLRSWTPHHHDVHVSKGRVKRAVIRAVHASDGRRVIRHLFLLDGRDRTVFRMCDRWWTDEQIGRVARHFEVPLEALPEAVHLAELRCAVPRQLQWNERHPLLTGLATSLGGGAACLLIGWLAVASL